MDLTEIKTISIGTRLAAMFLDHLFMTIIAMFFYIPAMISVFAELFQATHEQTNVDFIGGVYGYVGLFGFAIYFCKDSFNGQSIAKRILKLQLVDNTTGDVASPWKCFLRNLFIIIWPIEAIVVLTNTSRRLGDMIAGTKLVAFDPTQVQPKVNIGKVLFPVLIAYGLMFLFIFPFTRSFPTTEEQKVTYIETSHNQQSSLELEKLLNDSLGEFTTVKVKVYDKIKNQDLKYISIAFQFKESFIDSFESKEGKNSRIDFASSNTLFNIQNTIDFLVSTKFQNRTFLGQWQYIYKDKKLGAMQTISSDISWAQEK